ncbi:hypothetical protein PHYSODRAFT_303745 [Phytophthora sojae]|uniref:RxLR effector protein n=1 Tax=Phytophthora sojae (strain P6497) TaxID=1094619 RepID=G4ZXS4_PHYSP|nr:hypothetical protein PHYSODRAFT_303745 [Phytophthora sojae]EGZ11882.1 hypothetical protein PHYSODRAFT_303745 [Phytophthora sojae]|eukprot:XP_009532215.1 hypothetical protein PHYSODRAFT_303745 [Phytophthora sojae]
MKLMTTLVVAALVGLASATNPTVGTEPNAPARNNLRGGDNRMPPTSPLAATKSASPHTLHHHPSTSHQPTEAAIPARLSVSTSEYSHEQRPKAAATPKARSPQHDEWHPAMSHPPTTGPQHAIHREAFDGVDAQDDVKHPRRTATPPSSPHHSRQQHPATSHPSSIGRKPTAHEHEREPGTVAGGRELLSEPREAAEPNRVPVNGAPADSAPKSPRHSRHPRKTHPPTSAPPMPRPAAVVREFIAENDHPQRHPKPSRKHDTPAPPLSPHHQHSTQPPVERFHA